MKKVSVLFCCLLLNFCFSQNIDGIWLNKELRNSILDGSLESRDVEIMRPMFFEISKNKVANFYQVESSVKPKFKILKKIKKDTYTDGSAFYTIINENTLAYKTKTKNITFTRKQKTDPNDAFDTKSIFTKTYINFAKLSLIKNLKASKESNIKCTFDGKQVKCNNDENKFSYTIHSSNPYYNKKWNKLEFYIDTNINNSKKTYLIEKEANNSINLKDLTTDKIEYVLKY